MVINQRVGEYELDTAKHDGKKISVTHVPSGSSFTVEEGSIVDVLNLALSGKLDVPVYDDVTNVPDPVAGTRVHLTGEVQQPAGEWWYDGEQWFAGNRSEFSVEEADLGGNDTKVHYTFAMPADMEIDIWQAHIGVIDGSVEDVYLDIYDSTADEVRYEHSYATHGDEVVFGNPIDVVSLPEGNDIHLRSRNDTGGSVTFSGWLLRSFQASL